VDASGYLVSISGGAVACNNDKCYGKLKSFSSFGNEEQGSYCCGVTLPDGTAINYNDGRSGAITATPDCGDYRPRTNMCKLRTPFPNPDYGCTQPFCNSIAVKLIKNTDISYVLAAPCTDVSCGSPSKPLGGAAAALDKICRPAGYNRLCTSREAGEAALAEPGWGKGCSPTWSQDGIGCTAGGSASWKPTPWLFHAEEAFCCHYDPSMTKWVADGGGGGAAAATHQSDASATLLCQNKGFGRVCTQDEVVQYQIPTGDPATTCNFQGWTSGGNGDGHVYLGEPDGACGTKYQWSTTGPTGNKGVYCCGQKGNLALFNQNIEDILSTSFTCSTTEDNCTALDGSAGCKFKKNDNTYCCPGENVSGGGCSDISNVCYIDNNDTSGCLANRFYQCPKSSCDASNSADIQKLLDSSNCYTVRAVGEFDITNTIKIPNSKAFINDACMNVMQTFFSNVISNADEPALPNDSAATSWPLFLNKGAVNINYKSLQPAPGWVPTLFLSINIINKADIIVDLADMSDNIPLVIYGPIPIFNNYGTIELKNINMNKLTNLSPDLIQIGNVSYTPDGYNENNGIIRFVNITYKSPPFLNPPILIKFLTPFTNNGTIQYDNIIAPSTTQKPGLYQIFFASDNIINTGHIRIGDISGNLNQNKNGFIFTGEGNEITNSGEICANDQKAADVMCINATIVGTPCTLCASH